MDKAKSYIKKVINSSYFPFFIFFIVISIFHLFINKFSDDDSAYFGTILSSGMKISDFVSERYFFWSSRIIIELIEIFIAKYQLIIWRFLDIGIFLLLARSISKITGSLHSKIRNYIICGMILLIPIGVLNSAGWISTTMNYLWVVTFGLFSLSIFIDCIDKKEIKFWKYPIYIFTTLYACNQEQMAVVMFLSIGLFLIYDIAKNKIKHVLKKDNIVIIMFLISILSLIFILTCPGNKVRNQSETEDWFPEHENYNIIEKVELGLTSTMGQLIFDTKNVFIAFTLVIFISVCIYEKNKLYKVIASIPLIFSCTYTFFLGYIQALIPNAVTIIDKFKENQLVMPLDQINFIDLAIILGYVFMILIIPITFLIIFKKNYKFFIYTGIFLLGLITRFIMGFSPTIFISGERTFIFLYVSFIVCAGGILNHYSVDKEKLKT